MKKISFLVPCFNEEENVVPMSEALIAQMGQLPAYDYEIVFIDNDSQDQTRKRLEELCAGNKRIKAIFNARNFGQFNSPFYGMLQTTGDCVISLCADFQDPPEMIPQLVAEWEKGYKIVCAVKKQSKENRFVRFLRTIYYKLVRKLSSVRQIEHFTGFGLYDRSFVDVLAGLDDPAPFLRGIVAELGFKIVEVPYEQQRRRAGKTSNNFSTLYDAAMLSFTTYTKAPIRCFTLIGLALAALSLLGAIVFGILAGVGYVNFLLGVIVCVIAFLLSGAYIGIGILGEYVLTLKTKVSHRPLVVEERRINFDTAEGKEERPAESSAAEERPAPRGGEEGRENA